MLKFTKKITLHSSAFLIAFSVLLTGLIAWAGWVNPPGSAPGGNTAEIINIGPDYQEKSGTILTDNIRVRNINKWASQLVRGIAVNPGSTSQSGPYYTNPNTGIVNVFTPQAPTPCSWPGRLCRCIDDRHGDESMVAIGIDCGANGQITDFRILRSFYGTAFGGSNNPTCPATPDPTWGCNSYKVTCNAYNFVTGPSTYGPCSWN